MPYAEKVGKGNVLWPIRYALSGRDQSPDPFRLAVILGKEETLSRIKYAIGKL
jgi:glutamyl/glutaminyl-tRNA synthetase